MKTALISGSFDPVTRGHEALIAAAATLFDRVEVVIFENSRKKHLFTPEERLGFLQKVCAPYGSAVSVSASHGTVADYAKAHGISAILKGVRNATDLVYEQEMAALNALAGAPSTLLLPTPPALSFISSTAVREFLAYGMPVASLLPEAICEDVIHTYNSKEK